MNNTQEKIKPCLPNEHEWSGVGDYVSCHLCTHAKKRQKTGETLESYMTKQAKKVLIIN